MLKKQKKRQQKIKGVKIVKSNKNKKERLWIERKKVIITKRNKMLR